MFILDLINDLQSALFFPMHLHRFFFLKQILMSYHLLVLFKNVQICSFSNMHAATLLLVFSWGPAALRHHTSAKHLLGSRERSRLTAGQEGAAPPHPQSSQSGEEEGRCNSWEMNIVNGPLGSSLCPSAFPRLRS